MDLSELVSARTEIFERPKTLKDITSGKKNELIVRDFYDIISALSERDSNTALRIEGVNIIPPSYYSPQNFSKRGPVIKIPTFNGSEKEMIKKEWSEIKARIEANKKYSRKQGPFIGWAWKDPESNYHIIRPTIDIEGHRLHQWARAAKNIQDKIKVFNTKDSTTNTISVGVPSRSSGETQQVVIEKIPRIRKRERFADWTRVRSRHDCNFKRNDFTFRWGGNIVTYCPHDAAAYIAYSRQVAESTGEIIPQIFPMFTEPILRAFTGAAYHTYMVEKYDDNGKQRTRTRALSFPEIDSIIMDAWLLHGNKQTFFVRSPTKQYPTGPKIGDRKRMRDYNWSINAPGLPFGND